MARLFRKMVGKTCNQDDCTLQGQSADLKAGFCEACGKPLFELTAPDRVQQLLAVLVVLGALAGVAYGTLTRVRAQPVRQAASVPVGAAPKAAAVPRPSPPEAQRQMEARLRELHADVVVPIPLHWRRRWSRGYNQSAVLAHALAARLKLPCRPRQ